MSKQKNIEDADVVVDFRGGKDAAAKYLDRIKQLKAELDEARRNNYSGCVHTIATSVDREGCCVSCGEDLNYLAIMQIEKEELRQDLQAYGRHAAGCSAAFGDYKCKCGWDKVKESNK